MHIYCEFSSLLYRALKVCYNRVSSLFMCVRADDDFLRKNKFRNVNHLFQIMKYTQNKTD